MEKNQLKLVILSSIGAATFISAIAFISAKIGYRLGKCAEFDSRVDASECKPSRKWM